MYFIINAFAFYYQMMSVDQGLAFQPQHHLLTLLTHCLEHYLILAIIPLITQFLVYPHVL
jgi:hypothetical protein